MKQVPGHSAGLPGQMEQNTSVRFCPRPREEHRTQRRLFFCPFWFFSTTCG